MVRKCTAHALICPVCLNGGRVAGGHDGSPLPEGGIPIKAGKMRGLASVGMMCGITELGSDESMYPGSTNDGIYIFPEDQAKDLPLGSDAIEALGLHDTNFEYEITSCVLLIRTKLYQCNFIRIKLCITL